MWNGNLKNSFKQIILECTCIFEFMINKYSFTRFYRLVFTAVSDIKHKTYDVKNFLNRILGFPSYQFLFAKAFIMPEKFGKG